MTKATFKNVHAAIAALGKKAELVKGRGYFYFTGDDVRVGAPSEYVQNLKDLTLEEWMAHFAICVEPDDKPAKPMNYLAAGMQKRAKRMRELAGLEAPAPQVVAICAAPAAPSVDIVARSTVPHPYAYTIQQQAKAGNWVEGMSCNSQDDAIAYARHSLSLGLVVRVVDNRA